MKKLSPMRQKILDYISRYTDENGYPPAVREICQAVGLRSPSTVHSHLKILQEGGFLDKGEGRTRSITLKNHPTGVKKIPVLGVVTAGQPILMQEDILGYIPFEYHSGEYFALRVRGDSMIGAGILDGDDVIVRRQDTADQKAIVVAMLEDEATVKRLDKSNGHVRLLPEIPAYRAYTAPILSLVKHGRLRFAAARLLAKLAFFLYGTFMRKSTGTWTHLQYISVFLQPFLPNIPGEYDLAAQYLGVADTLVHKVNAKYKVAWNHTDYATQHPNPKLDRRVYTLSLIHI